MGTPSSAGWLTAYGIAGSAVTAAIPILVPSLPMAAGAALLIIAGLIFLAAIAVGIVKSRRERRAPRPAALPAGLDVEMDRLSSAIFGFLADRREHDPSYRQFGGALSPDASESERNEAWARSSEEIIRYSNETMSRYSARFEAQALSLYRVGIRAGLVDGSAENNFKYPTNPLGVAEVARTLGVIAEDARRAAKATS